MERRFSGEFGNTIDRSLFERDGEDHPEWVFDSLKEYAEKQSQKVTQRLSEGDIFYRGRRVEVLSVSSELGKTSVQSLQIAWNESFNNGETKGYLLQLEPVVDGNGTENNIIGYKGTYGYAIRGDNMWKFVDGKSQSLEDVFGAPKGATFLIKPTADQWMIEENATLSQGNKGDVFNLYMGLGFLFLAHQWMHIGLHEAGHASGKSDEWGAWQYANSYYAQKHKKHKYAILNGQTQGLFSLLHKPREYTYSPSIGKIMEYGMVSHALADGNTAKIPQSWQDRADDTIEEFSSVIVAAQQAYAEVMKKR